MLHLVVTNLDGKQQPKLRLRWLECQQVRPAMLELVIRENVGRHAETNTWHQKVEGVYMLTNTVNTVRRVALMSDSNEALPESMLKIEQSLILHSNGATITEGPPYLKGPPYRPLYKGLEGDTLIHELRDDGTRCGASKAGDVEAGRRCVGETTYKFKFNFTCAAHIVGGDTHTLVRIRYSIVGHPEIFIDTPPFRVVAKEDKGRDCADVSGLLKSLNDSKRLLDRAIRASDGTSDQRQAVLNDCHQKMLQMVAGVSLLARSSTASQQARASELDGLLEGPSTAAVPACQVTAAPASLTATWHAGTAAAASSSQEGATQNTEHTNLTGPLPGAIGEGSSSADGVVTNIAGELMQRLEGDRDSSATGSPSADGGDGEYFDALLNQSYGVAGQPRQPPPKRQRLAAAAAVAAAICPAQGVGGAGGTDVGRRLRISFMADGQPASKDGAVMSEEGGLTQIRYDEGEERWYQLNRAAMTLGDGGARFEWLGFDDDEEDEEEDEDDAFRSCSAPDHAGGSAPSVQRSWSTQSGCDNDPRDTAQSKLFELAAVASLRSAASADGATPPRSAAGRRGSRSHSPSGSLPGSPQPSRRAAGASNSASISPDSAVPAAAGAPSSSDAAVALSVAFHSAVARGALAEMDELAAAANVAALLDGRDAEGATPLVVACQHGQIEVAAKLRAWGANIDPPATSGCTPMHVACAFGQLPMAAWLHAHGARLDPLGNDGARPLHYACGNGHAEVAAWLHAHGAALDAHTHDGARPLHFSCAAGEEAVVTWLVGAGATLASRDACGMTPLHVAALHGRLEIAQRLHASGADITACANDGMQPLHAACLHGHLPLCRFLLDSGADLDAIAANGMRPFHFACVYGMLPTAQWLHARGAALATPEISGDQLLDFLNEKRQVETAEWYLQASVAAQEAISAPSSRPRRASSSASSSDTEAATADAADATTTATASSQLAASREPWAAPRAPQAAPKIEIR